jgi:hypothetical protein
MVQSKRPEHQAVATVLRTMDHDLLMTCACWFGGDTGIVLDLDEYRLSKDVDFLCPDTDGYFRPPRWQKPKWRTAKTCSASSNGFCSACPIPRNGITRSQRWVWTPPCWTQPCMPFRANFAPRAARDCAKMPRKTEFDAAPYLGTTVPNRLGPPTIGCTPIVTDGDAMCQTPRTPACPASSA